LKLSQFPLGFTDRYVVALFHGIALCFHAPHQILRELFATVIAFQAQPPMNQSRVWFVLSDQI
jgi:hypothetical protein